MTTAKKKTRKPMTKAQFERLSPQKKRLMIAKDVLRQLDARRYIPAGKDAKDAWGGRTSHGSFYVGTNRLGTQGDLDFEADAQKVFRKLPQCHVCAIGAAAVSAARVFDRLTVEDVCDQEQDVVRQYFPDDQADAMEGTFELVYGDPEIMRLKTRRGRLRAIFANVVKNKGDFIRSDHNADDQPTRT